MSDQQLWATALASIGIFLRHAVAALIVFVLLYFLLHRVLSRFIWRILLYRSRVQREALSERRNETLHHLTGSLMDALAVVLTMIFILGRFIPASAIVTTLGLFSIGIGIAARPFISDVLGGIVLLFEDQFALGEKVEIGDRNVIGVVEQVSLRVTHIRGEAGEQWIVPNGDVRTIRNFTRANFSPANIRLTVATRLLDEALEVLQGIITDPGPEIIEPPEIISEQGQIGEQTELMLKVKATYGKGAMVRRRLLARLQANLTERQIIAQAYAQEPSEKPVERNGITDRRRREEL